MAEIKALPCLQRAPQKGEVMRRIGRLKTVVRKRAGCRRPLSLPHIGRPERRHFPRALSGSAEEGGRFELCSRPMEDVFNHLTAASFA